MFTMMSFGAKIDESVNAGRGPYVFKVSDQIYHWIGSLCPPPGQAPRLLQLYIYDTDNEVENKMRHFGQQETNAGSLTFQNSRYAFTTVKGNKSHNACLLQIPTPFSIAVRDGYEVGGRIILPMSFTGKPGYMYAYYLDALAIFWKLGNPQFFITFTYNKIQSFVTFLKEERIFGNVTGVLYTFEFQKRGLPHCHTLLWVDSESKIKSAEDVDQSILAELPDPRIDPYGHNIISETMMHGPCGAANMKASCMKGDKS
ncbi:DNA helicase [Tanacetum coccineum]